MAVQGARVGAREPRIPERCRWSQDSAQDRSFGIHLCNVRVGLCSYRGPVYVLGVGGQQFECRKAGMSEG